MTILIIVGIIVLLGIIFASMYNSLVRLRNNRENAFADIDVQLKQRHDLIPQLVDTVKGYAAHEKDTLERVIQARNGAVSAKTIDEKIAAENQLSSALSGLKITLEAYPDLKANQNFLQLQEEVSDSAEKSCSTWVPTNVRIWNKHRRSVSKNEHVCSTSESKHSRAGTTGALFFCYFYFPAW